MTPRRRTVLIATFVAGSGAAACGVPVDDRARFESDEAVPYELLETPATTAFALPDPGAASARAELCFVHDDELVVVGRRVADDADPGDVLARLQQGPTDEEIERGLSTALPEGALAGDVDVSGGVASVALTTRMTATEGERQLLSIAQLVCTLTSRPGIGQVSFTLDGDPIEVPRGDGARASGPLARDDFRRFGIS